MALGGPLHGTPYQTPGDRAQVATLCSDHLGSRKWIAKHYPDPGSECMVLYGTIFTYIWSIFMANVGKYIPYIECLGMVHIYIYIYLKQLRRFRVLIGLTGSKK